jgi:hypothetical protein
MKESERFRAALAELASGYARQGMGMVDIAVMLRSLADALDPPKKK